MTGHDLNIHSEIIERCRLQDRTAQYKLYSLYSRAMFNICLRLMGNKAEAEDMLQEVFLEVFKNLEQFRYESTVGAWMKRIAVNRCINAMRKRRLQLVYADDMPGMDIADEPVVEVTGLSVERVQKAMNVLPDGGRVVFSLYLLEGYDHTEISEILGISESTSKTQYMRARAKVKAELEMTNEIY